MLAWVWRVSDQVQQLANNDPEYRKLNAQRAELDGAFTDLLNRLSESDRELLLEYMDVTGNQHPIGLALWYTASLTTQKGRSFRCGLPD